MTHTESYLKEEIRDKKIVISKPKWFDLDSIHGKSSVRLNPIKKSPKTVENFLLKKIENHIGSFAKEISRMRVDEESWLILEMRSIGFSILIMGSLWNNQKLVKNVKTADFFLRCLLIYWMVCSQIGSNSSGIFSCFLC